MAIGRPKAVDGAPCKGPQQGGTILFREEHGTWPGGEDSFDGAVVPWAIEVKQVFGQIKSKERPYWSGRNSQKGIGRTWPPPGLQHRGDRRSWQ